MSQDDLHAKLVEEFEESELLDNLEDIIQGYKDKLHELMECDHGDRTTFLAHSYVTKLTRRVNRMMLKNS